MDFVLFLLVNATLYIRPAEFIPAVQALPIYNVLMVLSLGFGLLAILGKLAPAALRSDPITVGVLAFLAAIVLSHLARVDPRSAVDAGVEFGKVVLFYLVLIAAIRTPWRLRLFLVFLVVNVLVLTALALLHYHGYVEIPELAAVADSEIDPATGEIYHVMRLCSTGIFKDPNDLSLVLIVGIGSALYLAGSDRGGMPRLYWLAPVALFLYALTLTYSRGGFLALLAGMMVLFYGRFGARKAAALAIVALPAMAVLFGGRQTDISTSGDTGQDRIQLWAQGMAALRGSPVALLVGIGHGRYAELAGLVAHNSFVHAYVELGLGGGCLFFGMFAYACRSLLALGDRRVVIADPTLRRVRPYLLAITAGYSCGMLTVSRNYIVPTYMILGLDAAYLAQVAARSPGLVGPAGPIRPLSARLIARGVAAGLVFLLILNASIKVLVRW